MAKLKQLQSDFKVGLLALLCALIWVVQSMTVIAAPLLSEPKFSHLSTENGLSQDTINALLIDQQGFLWVGTEGGLNRYDGYSVRNISFDDVALDDLPITSLLQTRDGDLLVGTSVSGLYQVDLDANDISLVGQWNFKNQPTWPQRVTSMFEADNGDIWLALDQEVIQLSADRLSQKSHFQILDVVTTEDHIVRYILVKQDILLVATSGGLFGVDLSSGQVKEINYLDGYERNLNIANSKFLTLHTNELFVGTVEGLFSIPFDMVHGFIKGFGPAPTAKLRIPELNIWTMTSSGENRYNIGTNQGLYNYSVDSEQLEHVLQPTDSRMQMADDDLRHIVKDKSGNLWMGTVYDGVLYWSPKSAQFNNITGSSSGDQPFSNLSIFGLYQQNVSDLWVATANGLNRYNLEEDEVESFLVNPDSLALYSVSTIEQMLPAQDDKLWLVNGEGLSLFDTRTGRLNPVPTANDETREVLNNYLWGIVNGPNDEIWFLNDSGLNKYNTKTAEVTHIESVSSALNVANLHNLYIYEELFPNSILIAETGKLWRLDLLTNQLELIHSIPELGQQQFTAPDSLAVDDKGTLWIAYPGNGLFGIDRENGETVYNFDSSNLLPSNNIYGLQKDKEGNIWMSSHRGLLKFYPENQHLQRFGYAEGVAASEFNQWAFTRLDDGRFVYGSQKGITVFDPLNLGRGDRENFKVVISEFEVASSDNRFPLSDLSGSTLPLEYNDVGITLAFSTLAYHHQKSTRYRYEILGDETVSYPITREPQANFSSLKPGDYEFKVSAFDPETGLESAPASVFIRVNYAPWASPMAYTLYALAGFMLLSAWWYRRKLINARMLAAHREVLETKNRLSMALTASNSSVWEWREASNTILAIQIAQELGYEHVQPEVPFGTYMSYIHRQDRALVEAEWKSFLENPDKGWDLTYRLRAADKKWLWFRFVGSAVADDSKSGKKLVVGTVTDVTESLANIEKVRLFGEAFKHTRDWVIIFDEFCTPVAANQAFGEAFGIDEQADLAGQYEALFEPNSEDAPRFLHKLNELTQIEHWKGEEHFKLKNGATYDVLVNMTSVASMRNRNDVDYYLMIMSDISEQKEAENELRQMANFDSLTKLPNRTLLLDRIKHAIDHAARHRSTIGLFFIDLDKFKQVNDSLGHKAGDELLVIMAQRLTNLLRQDDTVARLGGDEFVVMVEDVKQPDKLSVLAREIISVAEEPIQLGNQTVSVSSSVGIALYPNDALNSEELLKNSDVAMYHAKEQGRSNFQYFTEHMNQQAQARLKLENKLKHAHQQKDFQNYYQPIVSLSSGKIEGFELLLRWQTDDGMVPPDTFIPIAEELGLIENMTWNALEQAMPLLQQWQKGHSNIYLSVNLSARHFESQVPIEQVLSLLAQHDLPVKALRFEITEGALMKDYEKAQEYMQNLRENGFVIALDDFGTGYSSLKYLKEFPIQVLKVDKSFVDDIGKNKSNEALILTTLRMAESLNMYCVAEGIEDSHQIEFFKLHGCDYLQGYFFSKPVPADESLELISKVWET